MPHYKSKNNLLDFLVLTIFIIITRIPFISRYLFDWDAIQLAFGMRNFSLINHQPHPPGYFFYVYSAKLINIFVKNENYSLIIVNIILCVIATFIFYKISRSIFKNRIFSLLSSLVFITNPYIWFHSEFANVYMIDALFSLIYFYLAYIITIKNNDKTILFSFLLGIGMGFRQSLLIFFLPLYLYSLFVNYKNNKSLKIIILNLISLIISNLLWIVPVAYLSEGFSNFWEITKSQYSSATETTSIFNINKIKTISRQTFNTLKLFLYSGGIISIISIYYFIKKKIRFNKKTSYIFLLWFLPSFLFYSFVHLGKAGYIMTLTPLILLVGLIIIYKVNSLEKKYLLLLFIILLQSIFFLINLEPSKKFNKLLINVAPFQINAQNIKNNDRRIEEIIQAVKKYNPDDTILICEGDSPYIKNRTNFIKNIKHLNYYLPEYFVYYLFNDKSITRYFRYQKKDRRLLYQSYIPIGQKIKNIILVTDGYNYDLYDFKYLDHYLEENIFYKNISKLENFEYLQYNFVKQK